MIGNLILKIKRVFKQFMCVHDYKPNKYGVMNGNSFFECARCKKTTNLLP